jgi:hypothetical protein
MQLDYESEIINSIARSDPSECLGSNPRSGSSSLKSLSVQKIMGGSCKDSARQTQRKGGPFQT